MSVQPIVGAETGAAAGAILTPQQIINRTLDFPNTVGQAPGTGTTTGHTATAQSAHNMLKALMLELGFVVVATMVAGINDSWANGVLALMLALLVLRGLFEVDLFAAFAQGTALRP